ncbi:MAG: Maf family protein, partial [Pseudomonadota bacterium]
AEADEQVVDCLQKLSGRSHQVLSAISILAPGQAPQHRLVTSRVIFKRLSEAEIQGYRAGGEGLGKAGGYAIQGQAGAFIKQINGSYSAIVGLPLYEVWQVLTGLGHKLAGAP